MREPWEDFTRGLAAADAAVVLPHLRESAGASLASRFEIHRRNRRHALVEALIARHPVTVALVGDEFFRALADEYVRREPPRSAALLEYGTGFASFLDGFAPARAVACLPDVARLENAWQESYNAAEGDVLDLRALSGLEVEALLAARFEVHPATRWVASVHPVASLWQAHQGDRPIAPLHHHQAECAVVVRPHADVHLLALPYTARAFAAALLRGASFENAASNVDDAVDPVALLRRLLDAGAFTRILTDLPESIPC